jgi:hypothetical protein
VVLIPTTGNKANIRVAAASNISTWSVTTTAAPVDLTRPFSLGVFLANAGASEVKIIVEGVESAVTVAQSGTFANPVSLSGLRIGLGENSLNQRTIYSDVRVYTGLPTTEELRYIGFGYITGLETYMFPFDEITATGQTPNVTSEVIGPFIVSAGAEAYTLLAPFASERVPYMDLVVDSPGMSGVNLNIYATAPMSFGKTGKITNFRLIASVPWDGQQRFNVSEEWRDRFKAFSPNGYINFYVQVFDTETGVIPATQIKPPKRVRFKAGADAGTAVN